MERVLDFSHEFVLSAGTVSIDIDKNLVLLLFYRSQEEYILPKGRKDVGESLEAAAVRETLEETGFHCSLIGHDLPTRAPMLESSTHTEPIAVQQRIHDGIRKIIFWYVAQVDSTAPQLVGTQEEGEDFEAKWASTKEAASRMSFVDDRMIVEKALQATESIRIPLVPFSLCVREEYLDLSIDARALGFLCLSIGGGVVYQASNNRDLNHVKLDTDWDGFGLVETQADIIRLINHSRLLLCKLLRIEREEHPGFELPRDPALECRWDVVRFSGWTSLGSKRVIKIWSRESILRVASHAGPLQIGVISHKVSKFTHLNHPILGTHLVVFQPLRTPAGLHILYDQDFFEGPGPVLALADMSSSDKSVYCGVTCDLFLSSRCLFEAEKGIFSSLEKTLFEKWLLLSNSTKIQNAYPLMYRADRYTPYFKRVFQNKISRLIRSEGQMDRELEPLNATSVEHFAQARQNGSSAGFSSFVVVPQRFVDFTTFTQCLPATTRASPYPGMVALREEVQRQNSAFSSNSTGLYATIQTTLSQAWQQSFVKQAETFNAELDALPLIGRYFSEDNLQTVIAVDQARHRIFYKKCEGETFNDLRLQYHLRCGSLDKQPKEDPGTFERLLIEIELQRAKDVATAYNKSFIPSDLPTRCAQQGIHRFFNKRLELYSRFRALYGDQKPDLLRQISPGPMHFAEFLDLPWIINGERFGSLRHYLDLGREALDPVIVDGISSLPLAFGLGDGHGGNLMVSPGRPPSDLLYIDYEVAGTHTPFLDLAKPLYMDGFFEAAYADLMHGDLSNHNDHNKTRLHWKVEEDSVVINYALDLLPLSKALAIIKLEYTLVPAFEMLNLYDPSKAALAEKTLAFALFSCALLTRDYSKAPNVFFLNVALGIRLVNSMTQVFDEAFAWRNWPGQSPEEQGYLSHNGETQSQEMIVWGRNYSGISPALVEDMNVLYVHESLDFETVFLKRETETMALHKLLSGEDQNAGDLGRRIDSARKAALKISPYTCIRECMFAEPRIDRHFQYAQLLSHATTKPSKTFIDVGCCMGTDLRTLIVNGFPARNVMGLDREIRFIKLGFALYRQDIKKTAVRFREADVLGHKFHETCRDLAGRFDFVYSANVIHLFDELNQEAFLRALVFLVKPGGTIFGSQVGLESSLAKTRNPYRQPEGKGTRFTTSEFRQLWMRATGWEATQAHFEAKLVLYDDLRVRTADKQWHMQWTVRSPTSQIVEIG